jgi:serine/threonine-protein kinase RsbW
MDGNAPPRSLTLASQLAELPRLRTFLEAACALARLDEAAQAGLVLAVHEAAANVIRHAHRCRAELPFTIRWDLRPDGLEVFLDDLGPPFDVTAVAVLDPGELREGGRGVFLMRALVDELATTPRSGGGNTLRLFKRFSPAG